MPSQIIISVGLPAPEMDPQEALRYREDAVIATGVCVCACVPVIMLVL